MAEIIGPGAGEHSAELMGTPLNVFTWRPDGPPRLLLVVFHGLNRDAGPYRDNARAARRHDRRDRRRAGVR